jgi:hypothetical protein
VAAGNWNYKLGSFVVGGGIILYAAHLLERLAMDKILNAGYKITLFKNELGSFTAYAERQSSEELGEQVTVDNFTGLGALGDLIAKMERPS